MTAAEFTARNEYLRQTQSLELLGEIITWDLNPNTKITHTDLVSALSAAGLETKVARELCHRYAFARAAKQMAEQRIIRFVGEAQNKLVFQFTKEYKDSTQERYNYDFEATLSLEKDTGFIEVHSTALTSQQCQDLAEHAKTLLRQATETRTTADVTRVIKRLFEKKADLFPVRDNGSVYFVPNRHTAFVDQIQNFVIGLQGRINRFPVPAGTQHGNKSVQEAVTEGIQLMIFEHSQAVDEFGTDTRLSTVQRALDRIQQTQFKIEAYQDLLTDQREKLDEALAMARIQTQKKLEEVMAAKATLQEG
jgi:hypothetical protein